MTKNVIPIGSGKEKDTKLVLDNRGIEKTPEYDLIIFKQYGHLKAILGEIQFNISFDESDCIFYIRSTNLDKEIVEYRIPVDAQETTAALYRFKEPNYSIAKVSPLQHETYKKILKLILIKLTENTAP